MSKTGKSYATIIVWCWTREPEASLVSRSVVWSFHLLHTPARLDGLIVFKLKNIQDFQSLGCVKGALRVTWRIEPIDVRSHTTALSVHVMFAVLPNFQRHCCLGPPHCVCLDLHCGVNSFEGSPYAQADAPIESHWSKP